MSGPQTCSRCGSTATNEWKGGSCPACTLEFGILGYEATTQAANPTTTILPRPATGFGGYELLDQIGAGGMGVVYRALQISLNRTVAVKMLRPTLSSRSRDLQRFRAEAEIVARLRHPNIVAIHEVGDYGGQPFFAMEFVEGISLERRLEAGPLAATESARYLHTIAEAIHYAHRQGVLHRDLKPSNLIIDIQDQPRVLDFGLAKLGAEVTEPARGGTVLGSPSYMSPEQATGDAGEIDARSDVYSLGAVLYELLTGRPPFVSASPAETLRLVAEAPPVAPRSLNPNLPVDLETICLKCLAKAPDRRYSTAGELALDLQRFLQRLPIAARPVGLLGRGSLWARRQPLDASLAAGLLIVLLAGFAGVLHEWRLERHQRLRAEAGERRALMNLYAADMNLAVQAMEQGNFGQARDRLAPYVGKTSHSRSAVFTASIDAEAAAPRAEPPPEYPFDPRGFEWYHLWHATRPDPHLSLSGHLGTVAGLALSRDGRSLFSAGFDGLAQAQPIADVAEPTWSRRFDFHASSIALHPAGRLLAVGGDQTHGGWITDLDRQEFRPLPSGFLQRVAFSPDGKWLMCGSLNGWTSSTGVTAVLNLRGEAIRTLPESGGHLAFSADGRTLATGSWEHKIKLWSWDTDNPEASPVVTASGELGPAGTVMALTFSPDGTRLASGNLAGELQIWDLQSRELLRRVGVEPGLDLRAIAFSPDGDSIATGGSDSVIRVWDAQTLVLKWQCRGHVSEIWEILWTPDNRSILSAGGDGSISVWPTHAPPPRELIATNVTADYFTSALAFSPNSRWLSAALARTNLGLWDVHSGELTRQIGIGTPHLHAAFSADSSELFIAEGREWVGRRSVPELRLLERVPMEPVESRPSAAQLSDDARWLMAFPAESAADGIVQIWNARTGRHAGTLAGHAKRVMGARFSTDGRWLATGSLDRTARLWDLTSLREAAVLSGSSDAVTVLSFSADGRTLATGGWDGKVRLWSIPSGRLLGTLAYWDSVPVPEFLADGRTLGVMTSNSGIRLFNLETRRDTCTLRWPGSHPYRYVRCSPDGKSLACFSQDNRLRVWRAPAVLDAEP